MASKRNVKPVSFRKEDEELLIHAEKQDDFAKYVRRLIEKDMLESKGNYKFNREQEKAIIDLIKKYAPTVKPEDIKEFDKDAVDALGQFDEM